MFKDQTVRLPINQRQRHPFIILLLKGTHHVNESAQPFSNFCISLFQNSVIRSPLAITVVFQQSACALVTQAYTNGYCSKREEPFINEVEIF